MDPTTYQLIDTADAARRWLEQLADHPILAVDFEADGLFSYREKVCLIQVTQGDQNHIVDPLSVPEVLQRLGPVLASPATAKVFHGADYDVRLWKKTTGQPLRGLFDTMIAAQFTGREQVGLAALLQELFGVSLNKRYQKANWSRRPLERGMLEYAALDTAYLLPLREHLTEELDKLGRLSWAQEEFQLLEEAEPAPPKAPSCFDVKGARRLAPQQLAALQALLELREDAAEQMNRPPFKVLNNSVLLAWAEHPPGSQGELLATPGANRSIVSRLADPVLQALRRTRSLSAQRCPRPPQNDNYEPLTAPQEKRLRRLKKVRSARAEHLRLPLGLLVNTATLERLAREEPDRAGEAMEQFLKRWQLQEMGKALQAACGG